MKCLKRFLFLLVLCCCFLFYKDVFALEPYNDIPNTISYWSTSEKDITASVKEFNKYNTQFFGYTFSSEQSMQGWSFNFDGDDYLVDKSGSVNFAIYSNVKNEWRKPFQIYIKDYFNNISSCYTDSTSYSTNGSLVSSPVSSVICPNVQVRGNYSIIISNLTSNIANTIGISKVTFKFSTSSDIEKSIIANTEEQKKQTEEQKKQTEEQKKQTEEQKKINENITSEDSPDTESFFDDLKTDDSDSPVSDLLTMPLTLLNSYVNGFSSTCNSYNLGSLYDHDLILPCVSIEKYVGSNLWSLIDVIFTLYMVYNIGMLCVSIYESITELDDGMQLLYSPQHTGHSRVSRNEDLY